MDIAKTIVNLPDKCRECNHRTTKWIEKHDEQIRADERAKLLEEFKPLLDKILQGDCDWICEDICGTVEEDGEDWCYWHCKSNPDMDCLKKWCEYMRNKEE